MRNGVSFPSGPVRRISPWAPSNRPLPPVTACAPIDAIGPPKVTVSDPRGKDRMPVQAAESRWPATEVIPQSSSRLPTRWWLVSRMSLWSS